jgi:hypothetical protein
MAMDRILVLIDDPNIARPLDFFIQQIRMRRGQARPPDIYPIRNAGVAMP